MITAGLLDDVSDVFRLLDHAVALVTLDDPLHVGRLVRRYDDESPRVAADPAVVGQWHVDPRGAASVGAFADEASLALRLALRLGGLVDLAEAHLVGGQPLLPGGHRPSLTGPGTPERGAQAAASASCASVRSRSNAASCGNSSTISATPAMHARPPVAIEMRALVSDATVPDSMSPRRGPLVTTSE